MVSKNSEKSSGRGNEGSDSSQDSGLDLSRYVIRTKDGTPDIQATHNRFATDLHNFINGERIDNETIAQAVREAFQSHNVTSMRMGAVLQYTMERLNVLPADHSIVESRIKQYVRSNVNRFKIAKGKGGGVSWLDDEAAQSQNVAAPVSVAPPGSIRPRSTSQQHQQ